MIKIAFPLKDNILSSQFENCTDFQIYIVDKSIVVKEDLIPAPLHQPELIPIWLAKKGVSDVIAAGIELKAIKNLTRHKINVFAGVQSKDTKILVQEYLEGILETSENLFDH